VQTILSKRKRRRQPLVARKRNSLRNPAVENVWFNKWWLLIFAIKRPPILVAYNQSNLVWKQCPVLISDFFSKCYPVPESKPNDKILYAMLIPTNNSFHRFPSLCCYTMFSNGFPLCCSVYNFPDIILAYEIYQTYLADYSTERSQVSIQRAYPTLRFPDCTQTTVYTFYLIAAVTRAIQWCCV
jgi:hypothetical protein